MKDKKFDIKKSKSLVEENRNYWNKEPKLYVPKNKLAINGKPRVIDLFCGMGGLSAGFEMAGFDVVLGVDIHKPSIETFVEAHPRAAAILGDITKIIDTGTQNDKTMLHYILEQNFGSDGVDVLVAGIPCQGFSLNNKKRSELDKRNYMFLYFVKAVELFKPKYILIENVQGLRNMKNGSFEVGIKEALGRNGYEVTSKIFNAADFGVPQLRKRLVFLGAKRGYPLSWPVGTYGKNGKRPWVTVGEAISDLPKLAPGDISYNYSNDTTLTDYQKKMRGGLSTLHNHEAPMHTKATIDMIASTKPGEPMCKSFRQRIRLSTTSPSPTVVSGGIRPQFQFGHPTQIRGLTVREMCRIQSIPDHIKISGGMVEGRIQVGNAVPPLFAKAFAEVILSGLKPDEIEIKNQQLSLIRSKKSS